VVHTRQSPVAFDHINITPHGPEFMHSKSLYIYSVTVHHRRGLFTLCRGPIKQHGLILTDTKPISGK